MPQPSTLRLIRNAAALAAASPTLLFNDWKHAACLKRNESDWLRCDGTPVAVKCTSVSRWACRKRRRKKSPCMLLEVLRMGRTRHSCNTMPVRGIERNAEKHEK